MPVGAGSKYPCAEIPTRIVLLGTSSVLGSFHSLETATNAVKHVTYLGRSPHEAFFTPDWVRLSYAAPKENVITGVQRLVELYQSFGG